MEGGKKMSCNENKSGCGCNQGKCGCGPKNCAPKNCAPKDCGPKSGCEMTDKMMCQAEKAWESLFRRKLEAEFEKTMGPKMDEIASVVAKISIEKHQHMMAGKAKCEEGKETLKKTFMSGGE